MLIETVTTRGSAPAVNDDRQLGLHGQTWRFAFEAALTEQLEAKQAAPEPGLSTPEHEDAGRRRLDADHAGQACADGAQGRHDGGKDALHNTTELRPALATAAVAAGAVPVGGEVRAVPERLGVDALPAGPHGVPVASDLPMIDAILVEVANPKHPYGVRGVGETPIIPPLGAIANAMEQATGIRFTELPMSPPKVLKALRERGIAKG